ATGAAATAGTHAINATGGTASNYTIATQDGTLTVGKAALTVTADDKSKTVGELPPTLSYRVNLAELKYADTPSVVSDVSLSADVGTLIPGSYPIAASGGQAANYTLAYVDGVLTVKPSPSIRAESLIGISGSGQTNPAPVLPPSVGPVQGNAGNGAAQQPGNLTVLGGGLQAGGTPGGDGGAGSPAGGGSVNGGAFGSSGSGSGLGGASGGGSTAGGGASTSGSGFGSAGGNGGAGAAGGSPSGQGGSSGASGPDNAAANGGSGAGGGFSVPSGGSSTSGGTSSPVGGGTTGGAGATGGGSSAQGGSSGTSGSGSAGATGGSSPAANGGSGTPGSDNVRLVAVRSETSLSVRPGQSLSVGVANAFEKRGEGTLSYSASLADGSPLPSWLKVDAGTGSISGNPPSGSGGVVNLVVVARTQDGQSASTVVRIEIGNTR
ncbi:MAG: hypothetical protein HGA47_06995, partial [Zoogloea sp.]|nr:hypothetical protein [Zoogloea sp.]